MPGKRPRIKPRNQTKNVIDDKLEFRENKFSKKARYIIKIEECLTYDLWYDKHYLDRIQHGDENGKRIGINRDRIEELIKKSVRHLLYYSARIKGFAFLNHDSHKTTFIVLQDSTGDEILNVVVTTHFLTANSFEITVITAMCVENFKIEAGQYAIEFFDGDDSVLKKLEQNKLIKVMALEL